MARFMAINPALRWSFAAFASFCLDSKICFFLIIISSFDPYFLIPFKFKVKQLPLLSDKNILVRERFRENFLQKRWQKVPALHVAKHDVYELNQEILLNDL